jgi:hypothetical protein
LRIECAVVQTCQWHKRGHSRKVDTV